VSVVLWPSLLLPASLLLLTSLLSPPVSGTPAVAGIPCCFSCLFLLLSSLMLVYSYCCCSFPGFPAIARVSAVTAFPTAVQFSHSENPENKPREHSACNQYNLKLIPLILMVQAKPHSAYTQYKLNLIPHSAYTQYKRNYRNSINTCQK